MASNLVPGTSKVATLDPGVDAGSQRVEKVIASVTLNPAPNVEYGRTQAKSAYTTVNGSGPLVAEPTFGEAATVTLTTTASTKGDGEQTAVATAVGFGDSGSGLTVTYTVASNVASALTIVDGGSGYTANTTGVSVVGDTVKFTIATVS